MSQILKTKKYGEIEVDRSYVNGLDHVAKLTGGGYCHISGHPVDSPSILKKCIPAGKDLKEALDWFENKDKIPIEAVAKRIVINPDGSYAFDDGSEIENAADLIRHINDADALNAAVRWFAKELERRESVVTGSDTKVGAITKSLKSFGKKAKEGEEVEIRT